MIVLDYMWKHLLFQFLLHLCFFVNSVQKMCTSAPYHRTMKTRIRAHIFRLFLSISKYILMYVFFIKYEWYLNSIPTILFMIISLIKFIIKMFYGYIFSVCQVNWRYQSIYNYPRTQNMNMNIFASFKEKGPQSCLKQPVFVSRGGGGGGPAPFPLDAQSALLSRQFFCLPFHLTISSGTIPHVNTPLGCLQ